MRQKALRRRRTPSVLAPARPWSGPTVQPRPSARRGAETHRESAADLFASYLQRRTEPPASENRTGMPDRLKTGVERLAGVDLSAVRVHYASSKPAQLQALAYARGNDVHLGPGQEDHLPHEVWHVAQQRQGRVGPTRHLGGVPLNDDPALEREAEVMGRRALSAGTVGPAPVQRMCSECEEEHAALQPVQRVSYATEPSCAAIKTAYPVLGAKCEKNYDKISHAPGSKKKRAASFRARVTVMKTFRQAYSCNAYFGAPKHVQQAFLRGEGGHLTALGQLRTNIINNDGYDPGDKTSEIQDTTMKKQQCK